MAIGAVYPGLTYHTISDLLCNDEKWLLCKAIFYLVNFKNYLFQQDNNHNNNWCNIHGGQ